MTPIISLITAMAISMVIIPVMVRLAPRIGMIDRPDSRKVHAQPIPRAGGVGIVIGSLVPIALWLPVDKLYVAYLLGAIVLLIFGVWDDIKELGHYAKFIGQFIAVVLVVYFGDLYVTHLPFMGLETIRDDVGKPFTVFALIGMINAINHSDGLDGLAGGMSLLSLSCMAYLAFLANGNEVVLIALSTIGGVFGFLRYNTHPARVFMGDGGSQFLGFTLGFLAVLLIEKVNPTISPALPALMLGLPIADILAVFAQRVYHGMNWFRASKNHIHHRLLQLGFDHYEAVVIIYSIQILFVISAIFLVYETDFLILSIYGGVCLLVFVFLLMAERGRWRAHRSSYASGLSKVILDLKRNKLFMALPLWYVATTIPLAFILISLGIDDVPRDIGIASAVLCLILLLFVTALKNTNSIIVQAISYVTGAFVIYLETRHLGHRGLLINGIEIAYFVGLALAIGITIRYSNKSDFRTTPLDYLVIVIILFAGFLLNNLPQKASLGSMAVKLVILFYGCELIFSQIKKRWHILNISMVATLTVFAVRGLI
jgi:UDP-GlcNAc:undecaprenyl-phosphate GlcNAc-1-phosphate transferase